MDGDHQGRWRRVEAFFAEAAALAGEERVRFLDAACAGDEPLRSEIESLLQADETRGDPVAVAIDEAAQEVARAAPAPVAEGEDIGPYRLVGVLGRGGMSTVYRAVRADEEYAKDVAVKIMRSGFLGDETLERFRQERQILADLEHPNIARLIDGGTREDGTPFVVMELVDGLPIDEYARQHQLSLSGRLAVFREVCAAVQYAHQRLVVHRDLKPSNILVQPDGTPKLLDFGIAKLLDADAPAMTVTARTWMTPEYASPEQVRAERVSTTSDVYALGAVLYELLTGRRPYDFPTRSAAEIERIVCETVPVPPSDAVAEDEARAPGTALTVPSRRLRGDLDNIVLMALRKEPERRYRSAGDLADDIERFEHSLPVRSRPDTLGYRSRKFVRRHRWSVATAALVAALLIVFGIVMFLQAERVAQERDLASLERDKARRVAGFMNELLTSWDDAGVVAGDLTARQLVERGAEKLAAGELADQPAVRAAVLAALAEVYVFHGEDTRARELVSESHTLRLSALGEEHLETADSHAALGELDFRATRHDEAEKHFRRALALRRQLAGEQSLDVADSMAQLGSLLYRTGDFENAERYMKGAVERYRAHRGDVDPTTLHLKQAYSELAAVTGRPDEELALLQEVLAGSIALYGEEHLRVADVSSQLGVKLKNRERYAEAEPLYRRAIDVRRKHLGTHEATASSINNYGIFLRAKGSDAEAGPVLAEALEMYSEVLGREHPKTAMPIGNYAAWLLEHGSLAKAEALFEEALGLLHQELGADHWVTASFQSKYGVCLLRQGRSEAGEAELVRSVDVLLEKSPMDRRAQEAVIQLRDWYRKSGQDEKASDLLSRTESLWSIPD